MGKSSKRGRGGGSSSSSGPGSRYPNVGLANDVANLGACSPSSARTNGPSHSFAGAGGGSSNPPYVTAQAQRAANLGSTLIHVGIVWLVVGVLVKIGGGDVSSSSTSPSSSLSFPGEQFEPAESRWNGSLPNITSASINGSGTAFADGGGVDVVGNADISTAKVSRKGPFSVSAAFASSVLADSSVDESFAAVSDGGQEAAEATRGGNAGCVSASSVPRETLRPMGSYPDPLGISDEMRRSFFHPVVKFPEVWVEEEEEEEEEAAAAVGREGGPRGGTAMKVSLVNGDAMISSYTNKRKGGEVTPKRARWRPPWSRRGRKKVQDYVVIDYRATSGASNLIEDPSRAEEVASRRRREGFRGEYGIGRYDEDRSFMYSSDMFRDTDRDVGGYAGARTVHVGMDLGGPVGTKVHAFCDGTVHSAGYNSDLGDYGHVVVLEHILPPLPLSSGVGGDAGEGPSVEDGGATKERKVWALYGHLDAKSVRDKVPGKRVRRGQVIGRVGDVHENGGWLYPHVHFQLSTEAPETHDMPGAVSLEDRPRALMQYLDPRIVLGPLY